MTLGELIPSLRSSLYPRLAPPVWPAGARVGIGGDVIIGGVSLNRIAATFGTPCRVIDESEVRHRCRRYRSALPGMEIAYASRALLTGAIARWMHEEQLALSVHGVGELAVARTAGIPAESIILHGAARTPRDSKTALSYHAGRMVVDSVDEIERLASVVTGRQKVLVRVRTAADREAGFAVENGSAARAVRRVVEHPHLRLVGVHCHVGGQISRVARFEEVTRGLVAFLASVAGEQGVQLPQINLGGGHAVPYEPGGVEFDLAGFDHRVRVALHHECRRRGLVVPRPTIEPGRAMVAAAGVTLYRVLAVNHGIGPHAHVLIDGRMSDSARGTAQLIGRLSGAPIRETTVIGRYGDPAGLHAIDVPLPADLRAGDLLAAPSTGAYQHSLDIGQRHTGRPPLLAVADGSVRPLLRGETAEDLLSRDLG